MSYKDTLELQEISLVNYMAAIGYEPVFDRLVGLCGFLQPKFAYKGRQRVSVMTAIKMHNEHSEEQFAMLKFTPYVEFKEFISDFHNIDQIVSVFAGTVKIVEKIKCGFSYKEGLFLQSDKIKFMTKTDERRYGPLVAA